MPSKTTPQRVTVEHRGQRFPKLKYRERANGTRVYAHRVYLNGKNHWDAEPFRGIGNDVDAIAIYKRLEAEEHPVAPSTVTMTQLWETVRDERRALDPKEKRHWALGTLEKVYEPRWEKNIEPIIGSKRVQAVTAHDINRIFKAMDAATWKKTGRGGPRVLATGSYSAATKAQVRRLLSVLFAEAQKVSRGPIRSSSPMVGADLPEAPKSGPTPQAEILNWETDVDAIFGALRAKQGGKSSPRVVMRDFLVIWLCATTGMRISEILGLVWEDIDLVEGTIFLQQQLAYGVSISEVESIEELRADLKWDKQEDKPKTRKLALTPRTVQLLHDFKVAELSRGRLRKDGLVFSTYDGGPVSSRNIADTLKEAAATAKVEKPVHPHALRHAYATWLHHSGTPVERIKELLGHSSIETTSNYITVIHDETTIAWQREAQAQAGIG